MLSLRHKGMQVKLNVELRGVLASGGGGGVNAANNALNVLLARFSANILKRLRS
ncbi:MAG: hypothetical protein ACTS73_01365 [Arsenophonus sp. NEOnobi-MAG3]